MSTLDQITSQVLDCVTAVRRVQREIEQSRERIAASQRTLGSALERLCEADRRLQETDEGFSGSHQVSC